MSAAAPPTDDGAGSDDIAARNAVVRHVVELLVEARYEELLRLAPQSRIREEHLEEAIRECGRTLVAWPASAPALVEYYQVIDANPTEWAVDVPFFTEEEGLSDLTLQLSLIANRTGGYDIQLDGLHVL